MSQPWKARIGAKAFDRPAFGRHETFHLRYGWLTKGAQALLDDPRIFESDWATVELGVGKNMVRSIRHWLLAADLSQASPDGGYELTKIGQRLLGPKGKDPYLENDQSIWLIHWLLVSNPNFSTTWFWFFNEFHKPEFKNQELATALKEYAREKQWKVAMSTLKQDINVLLRMYTETAPNTRLPLEDALDSPLALLGLVGKLPHGRKHRSELADERNVSDFVIGYALAEMFEATETPTLDRDTILTGSRWLPGLGNVFRLKEAAVEASIDRLVEFAGDRWEFRSTAGVTQLYETERIPKLEFFNQIYKRSSVGVAA